MARKRRGAKAIAGMRNRNDDRRGGQERHNDGLERTAGSMAAAADAYFLHLETINQPERSRRSKAAELRPFLQWAQERELIKPEDVTRSILESYQRHLLRHRKRSGKPLSVATQRRRLNVLKSYFSWLCRERLLEANPASEIILPKREQRLPPEPLTIAQVNQLLGTPDLADPLGLRDRAVLEVFYSTGIRRSELCSLSLAAVQHEKQVLFVRQGKGRKDRVVPLGARALAWVQRYLDRGRERLVVEPQETALFLTCYGGSFNPDNMSRLVTGYLKQAKIDRSGSCHLLRHTCATHMLEGGADVRYVQELLGHAKLDTTAIYTRVSIERLRAVHARCHPAEQRAVVSELPAGEDAAEDEK